MDNEKFADGLRRAADWISANPAISVTAVMYDTNCGARVYISGWVDKGSEFERSIRKRFAGVEAKLTERDTEFQYQLESDGLSFAWSVRKPSRSFSMETEVVTL